MDFKGDWSYSHFSFLSWPGHGVHRNLIPWLRKAGQFIHLLRGCHWFWRCTLLTVKEMWWLGVYGSNTGDLHMVALQVEGSMRHH